MCIPFVHNPFKRQDASVEAEVMTEPMVKVISKKPRRPRPTKKQKGGRR